MRTKLISLLLAASIAATAGLSPAQAQGFDRDAQRTAAALAFGLATLAIIAKAAEAQRDDDDDDDDDHVRYKPRPQVITRSGRPLPRLHHQEHHRPQIQSRKLTVPSSCARRVQAQGGIRTAFGAPCLRKAGVNTARLPNRCERRADVGDRNVRFWTARCLSRSGVRID
ncbi:MAG: hypothetical protein AAGG09_10110 [Pseudomonadota bacterium]